MRVAVLALALALCACGSEPSFDERYAESENEIEQKARELEAQVRNADSHGACEEEDC